MLIESMGKQNESLRECKTSQNSADIVKLHMGGEHLSFMEAEEGDSSKSSHRTSIRGLISKLFGNCYGFGVLPAISFLSLVLACPVQA